MAQFTSKLGYEQYVQFPSDGRRHEIIDGEHLVNPAPSPYHQLVCGRLYRQLCSQIEDQGLGQVFFAPVDVQLSLHDIVQPDLVVVLNARKHIITPRKIKGPPDLIVEVTSESTAQLDRGLKKDLYQRAGVPEYWLVDLDEHELWQYVLSAEGYQVQGPWPQQVQAQQVPQLRVDLTGVW